MRYLHLLLIILLAATAASAQKYHPDNQSIRDNEFRWREAWNKHDVKALGELVTPDVVFVMSNGSRLHGRGAVEEHYLHGHQMQYKDSVWDMSDRDIDVQLLSDNFAIAHVEWSLSDGKKSSGTTAQLKRGIFTRVYVKEDGKWVIKSSQSAYIAPASDRAEDERRVREVVQSFYDAFNSHGWDKAPDFASEGWVHINPFGGMTVGRDATVKDLKSVHSTFLKGVTTNVKEMNVHFGSDDAAVVTVVSSMPAIKLPNGKRTKAEDQIRSFTVVRNGRWLIVHDQNTSISNNP